MRSFRGLPLFPLLTACLLAGAAVSCSGIGGGKAISYDSVYGNGTSGGSSGSSGDGSSTGVYVPLDITAIINSGDKDKLYKIFMTGSGTEGTSPITLDPDALGLPDGGSVTLTMRWAGGSYTRTVQKNADGRVMFDGIPSIADGTQVSVDLTVENAGHEKVWEGSGSNEVKDGLCNVDVKLKRFLPLSELADYIAAKGPNTAATAYKLPPLSGLTAGNLGTLTGILQGIGDYSIGTGWTPVGTFVDLSATTLSSGITSLAGAFSDCYTLVKPPVLPAGVTDMSNCFARCQSLANAPTIPAGVRNMESCFFSCGALTTAPVIPAGVTNMQSCFASCSNLTAAPVIPNHVQNMSYCFQNCSQLTEAPEIPASVTDLNYCFAGCTSAMSALTIRANITDPACLEHLADFSYLSPVYVINAAVQSAVITANSQYGSTNVFVGMP